MDWYPFPFELSRFVSFLESPFDEVVLEIKNIVERKEVVSKLPIELWRQALHPI